MGLTQVSRELQQDVRRAMEHPFRYERHERFAMRQLLEAGQVRDLADPIFVWTARKALRRRAAQAASGQQRGAARPG
jgi:hypothetical protein